MFKGYKKIYTPVLQTTKDYPKDISYRGKGLSNEYRLPLPCGLARTYKEGFHKKLSKTSEEEIFSSHFR